MYLVHVNPAGQPNNILDELGLISTYLTYTPLFEIGTGNVSDLKSSLFNIKVDPTVKTVC